MISLVAALTRKRVIGVDDHLPWRVPDEIKHFRGIIRGQTVILGRNTFELMKRHLESAHTIVISHSKVDAVGVDTCGSIEEALSKARTYGPDAFVVGGERAFAESITSADKLQLSYIKKDYPGNRFFPDFSLDEWKVESKEDFEEFEYVVYVRKA